MIRRLSLVLCASPLLLLLGACGGDDASGTAGTQPGSTGGGASAQSTNNPSASPKLTMPASRYSISQDDLGPGYITDIPATFVLDVQNYGKTATFSSEQEGQDLLTKWGYLGGYETGYSPEGRDVAVLNGAYYIKVEVHLFKDETGAKKAFDYFENRLRQAQSAQPVTAAQLGNQSSAWRTVFGKVPNSSVDAAYHRIVFRRGNLVSVVLTYGADPFMKVDTVRSLAVMVDQKALGEKTATEPTPVSSFVTPTPSSSGASPTASH